MNKKFDLKLFIAGVLFANHLLVPTAAYSQIKTSDSSEKVLMPIGMDVATNEELMKWTPSRVVDLMDQPDTSVRFAIENFRDISPDSNLPSEVYNNDIIASARIQTLSPVVDKEALHEHLIAKKLLNARAVYHAEVAFDPKGGVVYQVGFVDAKKNKIFFQFKSPKYIQIASQWIQSAFPEKIKEPGRKRTAVGRSILRFPGESAMFFIALGFGAYTQLLTNYASNPVALQQHLEMQRDPITHAAFAAFMAANAYTNEALMRSALAKSKMKFMIPYLGMTAGLMADRTFRDLITLTQDKDMAVCIDYISGNTNQKMLSNQKHPCDISYQRWVLDKRHEYGPALASLFISNFLAGQGELLVRQAGGKVAQKIGETKILSNGVKFSGLLLTSQVADLMQSNKALMMASKVATKAGSITFQGAKILVSGVVHIGRLYAFTQLDHLIMPYVNEVWMNAVQPGDIESTVNAIASSIREKESTGWKGLENNRGCKTIQGSYRSIKDDFSINSEKCESDLNVLVSDFSEKMTKWRTMNLEKVEMARMNWFEKVRSAHDMFSISEEFYKYYIEQFELLNLKNAPQKKLLTGSYPLRGVLPVYNENLFSAFNLVQLQKPNYVIDYSEEERFAMSIPAYQKMQIATELSEKFKKDNQKSLLEMKDLYLLKTDDYLLYQSDSMLQNLIQFFNVHEKQIQKLTPEFQKIAKGWQKTVEDFKQKDIYKNKPMITEEPKYDLAKIEKILGQVAYEIAYYRDEMYKKISNLPNPSNELVTNHMVISNISRAIGNPKPAIGIGEGFVAAYRANSVRGKNIDQILYPASNGAFDTKTWIEFITGKAPQESSVLDFLVVQMACGPDIEDGPFIKDNWAAQGGRVEFIAPRLTSGDRPALCEYNYTKLNRPTTDIYRATFSVKNSNNQMIQYKGLFDYINKNLRSDLFVKLKDEDLKKKNEEDKKTKHPFMTKWDRHVLPAFAKKMKDLETEYFEVLALLNETIQSKEQYPLNNSKLANSPLYNIEQELVTYQNLLNYIVGKLKLEDSEKIEGMNHKLATSSYFDSLNPISKPIQYKFQQNIYSKFSAVTQQIRLQTAQLSKRKSSDEMQKLVEEIKTEITRSLSLISAQAERILDPKLEEQALRDLVDADLKIQEIENEGSGSSFDDSDNGIAAQETKKATAKAYLEQNSFDTLLKVEAQTLNENQYKVLVAGIILDKMTRLADELGVYFTTLNNLQLDPALTARLIESQNETNQVDCERLNPFSKLWHNSCRLDK